MTDRHHSGGAAMEFHVSRAARDRYQFDESLFQFNGNVIFANFHAARVFAQKINQRRDLARFPEQAARASQISAMGLIDEIAHAVFKQYREQTNPQLLGQALAWLDSTLGAQAVDTALRRFSDDFPPIAVYRREQSLDTYITGVTGGISHREAALEELLMLWLANQNPAFAPYHELFDDTRLAQISAYPQLITGLQRFMYGQPAPASAQAGQTIIDILRAPALAAPHSLEGQLAYILEHWGALVGGVFPYRLLSNLDLIKEEQKPAFEGFGGAPVEIPSYQAGAQEEPERFTADRAWMPRLVLLAKNAYVWIDQLSKRYQRPITSLAQIPDEELDSLAHRGITGLWLIGLWERSRASQRIKQMMGNPEAVASAYSLFDYQIAGDLGGEEACANLRERAWQRGIRLASDMVPNHVGIDGRWVVEHPDWFVSSPYSPFPAYSFNGADLSWDERVGIFLEDHYYTRNDAAVVFKRIDRWSGTEQYIYHGNDGTSMPWNDTAQLDYLKPEVREAVIQTILHVARQFPIIRFDAAMTLAKKHYQRLWFPEPGTGGDIPSRAEHGLTREQFDGLMPQEFWREVVDRAAVEAPDTLLLAEAFWLMESYFVRTLGMHRVYNSAFMHLLRDEDNAKYRLLIKNTLEFDPEILRRYVNFMNNPDERTAVDQFGKDDKYFGVCTLMVTTPGLPMFGHGQFEGFAEKYGMEYRRAYWEEQPDSYLIERHEREIVPLLHRRELFSGIEHFLLYDFYTADGTVDENVLAHSNRLGDDRALVMYHNAYATARGWVRQSAAFAVKQDDERRLVQRTIGEGLGLRGGQDDFCIFRDQAASLEYIRSSREIVERGLFVELGAYKCHVFMEFREVTDSADQRYRQLAGYLNGRGVPSVEDALRETFLRPVLEPFRALVNAELFRRISARIPETHTAEPTAVASEAADQAMAAHASTEIAPIHPTNNASPAPMPAEAAEQALAAHAPTEIAPIHPAPLHLPAPSEAAEQALSVHTPPPPDAPDLSGEIDQRLATLLREIQQFSGSIGDSEAVATIIRNRLTILLEQAEKRPATRQQPAPVQLNGDMYAWGTALSWVFVHALGTMAGTPDDGQQSLSWLEEWMFGRVINATLAELGAAPAAAARGLMIVKILTGHPDWYAPNGENQAYRAVSELLADEETRRLIQMNRYQGVLWFNKERFEELLAWLLLETRICGSSTDYMAAQMIARQLQEAAEQSGYQVERLIALTTSTQPVER